MLFCAALTRDVWISVRIQASNRKMNNSIPTTKQALRPSPLNGLTSRILQGLIDPGSERNTARLQDLFQASSSQRGEVVSSFLLNGPRSHDAEHARSPARRLLAARNKKGLQLNVRMLKCFLGECWSQSAPIRKRREINEDDLVVVYLTCRGRPRCLFMKQACIRDRLLFPIPSFLI